MATDEERRITANVISILLDQGEDRTERPKTLYNAILNLEEFELGVDECERMPGGRALGRDVRILRGAKDVIDRYRAMCLEAHDKARELKGEEWFAAKKVLSCLKFI